ncbi:flagellar hook-length control protein FliK [Planococcus halocryophilus]|uniref:flagellar hook-length control protein FliK n=1 Tax=Planococcus halocryophilus TaxID=1215089 RepID=UPI001F0FD28A|nr:flagellar hook-length control protein FliK [Planococcus halocryophilus]MCH4827636.1 flagellar hook-length control protein FliK [Planococcus halocryophilus]
MEALKAVQPTISPFSKVTSGSISSKSGFASLLESLSIETATSNNSEDSTPVESVLESLTSLLTALQEIPLEERSDEQQEILYAILQLQTIQSENKQTQLTGLQDMTVKNQSNEQQEVQYAIFQLQTIQSENKQVQLTEIDQVEVKAPNDQSKLVALLEKLQVLLGKLTDKTGESQIPKDSIIISKQLDELIKMLEKQPPETKVNLLLKTMEQHSPIFSLSEESHSVNELPRLVSELLKPLKEVPKLTVEPQEVFKEGGTAEVKSVAKLLGGEEIQTTKVPTEVKVVQESPAQPVTFATDAGKSASTLMKAETNLQTAPVVRLPNLLEDLSGMLKSSMRLAESPEGMKMRVNIFPEHLGHLEILMTSTNGKLAAQIMTSTPMAKEALELQLNQLRASLIQQGVEVEKIEVLEQSPQQPFSQQQPHAEQRSRQQQQGKNSRNSNSYFQSEEDLVRETRKPLSEGLMKVDYTV